MIYGATFLRLAFLLGLINEVFLVGPQGTPVTNETAQENAHGCGTDQIVCRVVVADIAD